MAYAAKFIAVLCLMLIFAVSGSAQAQTPALNVAINDVPLDLNPAPFVKEGQAMAPLRSFAGALNASVSWDAETNSIIVTKQNKSIRFQMNNRQAYVNEQLVELPIAPEIVDERAFVPLSFLAEALGFRVECSADKQEINLMPINYLVGRVAYGLIWENNKLDLIIENISYKPVVFNFNTGQEADFTLSKKEQIIWRWSEGRMFTQNTWELDLQPGERHVFSINLNQPVDDGKYKLEAFFLGQPNPNVPVYSLTFTVTKAIPVPPAQPEEQ